MAQSAIATAADYADAMLTARKARNILIGVVLLMLLGEIALFFAYRYRPVNSTVLANLLRYLVGAVGFLSIATPIVLGVDLLLIVAIMLVGRLIGVSHVVSSFLWCVVLAVMLFPWQGLLTANIYIVPGVVYSWNELIANGGLHSTDAKLMILMWARFVIWPIVAIIILLMIHSTSRRGLRMALGEDASVVAPPTEPS